VIADELPAPSGAFLFFTLAKKARKG